MVNGCWVLAKSLSVPVAGTVNFFGKKSDSNNLASRGKVAPALTAYYILAQK